MQSNWRDMMLEDVPTRFDIEDHIILSVGRGFGNSDRMRSEWLRERFLKRTGDEGDVGTPIGKFTNEHAWVLGNLNTRRIIEKISAKVYKPYSVNVPEPSNAPICGNFKPETNSGEPPDVPLPNAASANFQRTALRSVRDRQSRFRDDILKVYGGCAITRCQEDAALQAAHVVPYVSAKSNALSNGLCLRVDLHCLFDRGLIEIRDDYTISVSANVRDITYRALEGRMIYLAEREAHRVNRWLLAKRRLFNATGSWQ